MYEDYNRIRKEATILTNYPKIYQKQILLNLTTVWEQQIHRCYLNARHTYLRLSVPQGTRADLGRKETSQEKRTFFTFYSTHKCNLSCLVCASRHQTTLQSIPSPCSRAFNLFLYEIWKKYLVFLLINHESLKKNQQYNVPGLLLLSDECMNASLGSRIRSCLKNLIALGYRAEKFRIIGPSRSLDLRISDLFLWDCLKKMV